MEHELRIALDEVTERTGWNVDSQLIVTLRYLDQLMTTCGHDAAHFRDFLMQQAEEEGHEDDEDDDEEDDEASSGE